MTLGVTNIFAHCVGNSAAAGLLWSLVIFAIKNRALVH